MRNVSLSFIGKNPAAFGRLFLLFLALLALTVAPASAQAKKDRHEDRPAVYGEGYTGPGAPAPGGYTGPGPALVSVEQAKGMGDDSRVALKGTITQSLGGKDYMFKDASGSIEVKISHKLWGGRQVGPADTIELHGKVDKDWTRTRIDVKRIITP